MKASLVERKVGSEPRTLRWKGRVLPPPNYPRCPPLTPPSPLPATPPTTPHNPFPFSHCMSNLALPITIMTFWAERAPDFVGESWQIKSGVG